MNHSCDLMEVEELVEYVFNFLESQTIENRRGFTAFLKKSQISISSSLSVNEISNVRS